jgi:peroxiredoxin
MSMRNGSRLFRQLLVLGFVAAAILSGCGRSAQPPAAVASAPDFTLTGVDGKVFHLADTKGTVRLVDFWATWCAPCREEIPMFKDFHELYGSKGFTLVGIAMDDEGVSKVKPFVDENKLPYLTLIGNETVAASFGGLVGFPSAFLIDREGRIVDSWVGAVPRAVLEKRIQSLL